MPRYAAKTDDNQQAIIDALRQAGCSVAVTARLPKFVDIVVGVAGQNYLLEIKQPGKADQLTPFQAEFHREWRGSIFTVTSVEGALKAVGIRRHEPNWNRSTG